MKLKICLNSILIPILLFIIPILCKYDNGILEELNNNDQYKSQEQNQLGNHNNQNHHHKHDRNLNYPANNHQPNFFQSTQNHLVNLINSYQPKLRIYLRELKDNSLLLLIFIEPQLKEIEIIEYQVNYTNKLNNKDSFKIQLNQDSSKRLIVELKDLNQNTPYKICISATLSYTCDYARSLSSSSSQDNLTFNNNDANGLLNEICNYKNIHADNSTKIHDCIDNIITQKSISIQALTSSLGAIICLLMIMSCIYLIQLCKPTKTFRRLNCRKPHTIDEV